MYVPCQLQAFWLVLELCLAAGTPHPRGGGLPNSQLFQPPPIGCTTLGSSLPQPKAREIFWRGIRSHEASF